MSKNTEQLRLLWYGNETKKNNLKGIIWFLVLTFSGTYCVELILYILGFTLTGVPDIRAQMTVAGVMFFPGLSAYAVRKFITKEGFGDAGLRIGNLKYYLGIYALIPALFAAIYALTWIFVKAPDFSLNSFTKSYGIPDLQASPGLVTALIFLSTITFAPFLNSIPAFGEEFGWRGYLLPKLLPLGKTKAIVISGIIWGLWHAPLMLMGYKYGPYQLTGILFFTVLLTFIGVYIGYLQLASKSVFVSAFAHGTFNAQAYGVWTMLFPSVHPLLGGLSGLTGIAVFAVLAVCLNKKITRISEKNTNFTQ